LLTTKQKERIKQEFAPVLGDPEETAKRTIAWCLHFFGNPENPQHFYLRSGDVPKVHWGIHLSLSLNCQFYYCTSPRAYAKSTHLRLNTMYRLYYAMEPYILLIGKIGDSGKEMMGNIKYDIENNEKLIEVYGQLKPQGRDGLWSAHDINWLMVYSFVRLVCEAGYGAD